MATGQDWTHLEVDVCVADYLQMLTYELNGQQYNKTRHAEAVLSKLDGRSRGSLEFKHQNISAVMRDLGYPYITGYKPRGNYQGLLLEVLEQQLPLHPALQYAAEFAADQPAIAPPVTGDINPWVLPPVPTHVHEARTEYAPRFSAARRDYVQRESRNRSLGMAGEIFVAELETRRLHAAGQKTLSARVEHVAKTQGDGLGYDIHSFDEDGRDRLIEVKTTGFGELTPFYVSRNELARSRQDAGHYHLYRVFEFRSRPRLFVLSGEISAHCQLDPVSYRATLV